MPPPLARRLPATPQTRRLALLDAMMGYVGTLLPHGRVGRRPPPTRLRLRLPLRHGRSFHTYFVTHLPSSSLHPDSRRVVVPHHHKLPRDASTPHTIGDGDGGGGATKTPAASVVVAPSLPGRDLTVVRIPLRSAKHHYGAYNARGSRPYNEDAHQAGTIDLPAFAKRAPISLVRSAMANSRSTGEGITADGAAGDPQIFYFGIFDGHGGTECATFLRDELPRYIEQAAAAFGLGSSLRHHKNKLPVKTASIAKAAEEKEREEREEREREREREDKERGEKEGEEKKEKKESQEDKVLRLERDLLQEYRTTIGGYFRRFQPAHFVPGLLPPPRRPGVPEKPAPVESSTAKLPPVTIETVMTYAFLRADLDFVTAQAKKPDPDDPWASDMPLNEDEVFGRWAQPPTGPGQTIGGPMRFKGGSTASVLLISTPTPAPYWNPSTRASLLVAHVGDTRVLLCETATGLARPMTSDHHPAAPLEARRLTRYAESLVTDSFGEERIAGLANSRAFGDMQSKRIGVSAEPDVERIDMAPAQYSFVVLVSDGVSGTLADQEIVDVVKEARTPEQAARDVVDYATEVSRDGDNATCLVVRLGGWERRSEGGLGSMGTKEVRDARRAEAQDPRRGRM